MDIEQEKVALSEIMEILLRPYEGGINYDYLKVAADRHTKNIEILESGEEELIPTANAIFILARTSPILNYCLSYYKEGRITFDHSMMMSCSLLVKENQELKESLNNFLLNSETPSWNIK